MTFYYKDNSPQNPNGFVSSIGDIRQNDTRYAARNNGVIYIQDKTSGRYVTFKAYLNSFKLSISPNIELNESIFVIDPFVSRGQTLFRYSLSVDVPANDITEATNNLAKMQELFRYVGTLGNVTHAQDGREQQSYSKATEYCVSFSNLICKGDDNGGAPIIPLADLKAPYQSILDTGISGIVKKVEFKPSMDTGFFEVRSNREIAKDETGEGGEALITFGIDPSTLFIPKHYTLDLELLMINSFESLNKTWPFMMRIFV